jgi:acetyl-CoA synthetase
MSSEYVWTPGPEQLENSRAARFMKRHGVPDLSSLIERSIRDPDWFWPSVIDEVGIHFQTRYDTLVDLSEGHAWARWFVGGRLNLVHSLLDKHITEDASARVALIAEGEDGAVRRWAYRELFEETCRFAAVFEELGVKRGDRVGLFLPMFPEAVAAFLAVIRLGAVAVPIFSGFGVEAVAARLNDSSATLLVTVDGVERKGRVIPIRDVAAETARHCPSLRGMLVIERLGKPIVPRTEAESIWSRVRPERAPEFPCRVVDSEDPALLVYTSGTTGKPKGAVHVNGGFLVKIAQEVAFQVDMTEQDRLFWLTDLGWIMGPWEIVGGLATGGAIVLYDGAPDFPGPDRLWAMVERHRISLLGVSPTLIRALLRHGTEPVRSHDLTSLRILASTGEPWNTDPWLWFFREVGRERLPIINISGGTEIGACLLSPLPITPLKTCTLGGPALGMDVAVVNAAGEPLGPGMVGELVCRSAWPSMTRGLWNDPARYKETYWSKIPGVWTHGDFASIDESGLWYLHGRSDDTLNVAGKRIGPAEVESVLVGHPAVTEAAAIGVPHELKGEAIWCFVVLRSGAAANPGLLQELRERVSHALGKSFQPEEVRVVAELPRTRNAKIMRRALRAKLLGVDPGDLSNLENPACLEQIERLKADP